MGMSTDERQPTMGIWSDDCHETRLSLIGKLAQRISECSDRPQFTDGEHLLYVETVSPMDHHRDIRVHKLSALQQGWFLRVDSGRYRWVIAATEDGARPALDERAAALARCSKALLRGLAHEAECCPRCLEPGLPRQRANMVTAGSSAEAEARRKIRHYGCAACGLRLKELS
jgi:hypothetical protein